MVWCPISSRWNTHQSNVPMIAIMCEIILSFGFLFFMSNIGKLIICAGMINWICKKHGKRRGQIVGDMCLLIGILLAAVGLIVLRYKDPDRKRPIKIPLIIPIIFITALVILIVASALTDLDNILTSLMLLGTAVTGLRIRCDVETETEDLQPSIPFICIRPAESLSRCTWWACGLTLE